MDSIIKRAFSPFAVALRAITLTLVICATGSAWADFAKTNPVTGETENYTWKFVGTDTWNGAGNWQDSSSANPSGTPAKSGENTWDPILFDGDTININASMSVEGWNLRMGLYNGANVTMNTFLKYQGDTTMWMTVDETSQLTVGGFSGGNITDNQVIKLSVAKASGITWTANLTSVNANNTFEYYLKGAGSVSYQAVSAANHKIKMADVTLSGNEKSVQSKTLVSFTSSTPTFTADASIKVKDSEGNLVCTKALSSVTSGSTTLTGSEKVGTCELVQTSTGIVLYYVDGDPAEAAYTPSININFTHNGNGINTEADLGLTGYAVPGSAWNNIAGIVGTTSSTIKKIDSTGTATVDAGVSVEVSNTRGSYRCNNLSSSTELRHGYIDESDANATPTVTITGIPYTNYRVIVYHATDSGNSPFGYDTINGTNFTYVDGVQAIGTDSWGSSGAYDGANAIAEGVNTLVSGILSGSTVTMVAHRIGTGSPSARGCFAAIQVVQVDVGEGNLLIPVSGDTTYTVSEDSSYTKVIVSGTGTLTLEGTGTITAGTLEIEHNSAIIMNEARIASTTVIGGGTAIYDGAAPTAGKGWKDGSNWTGTVQVKNVTNLIGTSGSGTYIDFNEYGNANSVFELNGVTGWINPGYICNVPLKITNTLYLNNGYSNKANAFKVGTLLGAGTISGDGNATTVVFNITDDWSGFTGTIGLNNKCIVFGETIPDTLTAGTIYVSSGAVVTPQQASGTWWAVGGIKVDGELRAPNLGKFGGGTTITTTDNGIFTLLTASQIDDQSTSYARITGTGTLRYADGGNNNWRTLSQTDFPTGMICENNLSAGLILKTAGGDHTIGSLAGSGKVRSDWGNGNRNLKALQAKDTVYSGLFDAGTDRVGTFTVAPGASSAGTLTLSGTQTASNDLVIESGAAVNLTGTWVGATTVAGTFGGTGTVTGNLTFSDGATFKAAATALTVSGTVTLPTEEGETLTIDASAIDAEEVTILSSSSITTETDVSKVTVANGLYNATPVAGALKLVSSKVEITVPAIANTTVTVSVGGETIGTASGTYKVAPDAVVTVTYAAASGYEISGTTVYTINVANSETTFDPTGTTQVAQYVAQIVGGASYTSLQAAVTAVAAINNGKMLLVGSAEGMIATIPAPAPAGRVQFYIAANGNTEGTVSAPAGDYIMTTASQTIQIDYDDYPATKYTVVEAAVAVTISGSRSLYGASYINDAVNAAIAGGLGSTIEFVNGTDSAPYVTTLETSGFTVENNVWTFTTMPVAKVTHGVIETKYLTLETAVANALSGDTITLLGDVTLTTPVAISETLTLDMNGYAITASGIDAITSSGALTIQGSSDSISVTSGNSVVLTDSAATLTVTGVTLSPEPTTNVSRHRVVSSTSAGTTSYIVEVIPGTIFSVY